MSFKDYGRHAIGGGLAVLGLSIYFTAQGAFERFDRAEALVEAAPETIRLMDEAADRMEQRAIAFNEALPDFGTTIGESGANAVERAEELLIESDRGQEGVRGKALELLDSFMPEDPS